MSKITVGFQTLHTTALPLYNGYTLYGGGSDLLEYKMKSRVRVVWNVVSLLWFYLSFWFMVFYTFLDIHFFILCFALFSLVVSLLLTFNLPQWMAIKKKKPNLIWIVYSIRCSCKGLNECSIHSSEFNRKELSG